MDESGIYGVMRDPPPSDWWKLIVGIVGTIAVILIAMALASCGDCTDPAPRPVEPVPAASRAEDLDRRLSDARLRLAEAKAAAEFAANDADRAKAQVTVTREDAIAAELRQLRDEARAEIPRQQAELDARAAKAAADASERATKEQAARDRRWALLGSAGASALAVAAGLALWWIGMPKLAVGLPLLVTASAGVGLGILSAGPWLAWILGGTVVLAVIAGLVIAGRAIFHAVAYGEVAGRLEPSRVESFREDIRAVHEKAGVRGLIGTALNRVRKA